MMNYAKRHLLLVGLLLCLTGIQAVWGATNINPAASWIAVPGGKANQPNCWTAFRRDINISTKPAHAYATIAADTKYWLWINGRLAVFEGGLKRGPTPRDTYYDRIDLAPYLKPGLNQIALLQWYFGKDGFSHVSSGQSGLLFSLEGKGINLQSNRRWLCRIHPGYGTAGNPKPNERLPESNIKFDAQNDMPGWQTQAIGKLTGFEPAAEVGHAGDAPWNQLVERPIPQWKDFGVKEVQFKRTKGAGVDTITARLPYNMQLTPTLVVQDSRGGHLIRINTDHSFAGGTNNIRAEYVTAPGRHEYESYGWMNGERLILTLPPEVELLKLKYRETGFNTQPDGSFTCSSDFYNRFWQKAERTLYVNMRDNYFDCPDRERAQWWGDAVLLMGESFYTYSTSSHTLMRKAIRELIGWRRPSGVLHAPVPGVFDQELPDQMLTSIGRYGFWNYYLNTGDRQMMQDVYPAVKDYLALWKTDDTGLTELRKGDWLWGDWGDNRDIRLIMAGWHYLALDGAARMAALLGYKQDEAAYRQIMEQVKAGYNKCWTGTAYRHPSYQGKTDDRVQALAVILGIADSSKYAGILATLKTQWFASPYMEKYVMEALFTMGQGEYAMQRTQTRFADMVNDPNYTTLFEGWGIGNKGYGGGTTNHAWSGGAQIVIAQQLFGIRPIQAGYETFSVEPCPAGLTSGKLAVPTIRGKISAGFENTANGFKMDLVVPKGTIAVLRLPGNPLVFKGGKQCRSDGPVLELINPREKFTLAPGVYKVSAKQIL